MKTVLIYLLLLSPFSLFAQKNIYHSINFEFSSPTIFHHYPDKSQVYNIGYEFKIKRNQIDFGLGVGYGHHRFRFKLKLPYDFFKNGQTPLQAYHNIGFLFYDEERNQSPILVNGFNPTLGIGFVINKKQ